MLKKPVLASAFGAALLAACAHQAGPGPGPAPPVALPPAKPIPTPTPAPAIGPRPRGFALTFIDEGRSAKLAYGQPNTDYLALMLQCAKGSKLVEVTDMNGSTSAGALTLVSGAARSDLKATVEPGAGAPVLLAHTPAASPALAAFRRTGIIEVSHPGVRYGVTATAAERIAIERFFAACDRRGR